MVDESITTHMSTTRWVLAAAVAVAATVCTVGATTQNSDIGHRSSDIGRAVDAIFSPWNTHDSPGCAVGVFQNGAIAYSHGYGMASLEHDVPIAADSVFYAGSVSKQFTAMAAALAMQRGKLSYDDSIRKYLPELPPYANRIKISNLIHHTSGLRDYNTLLSIAGRRDEDAWDNRVVLQMTARQSALNFEPGTEYLYSNTRRLVRGRAFGYAGRAGAWTMDTPINERAGAGGLYTNIPDLQKWDENFYTGRVGGPDVLKRIQTRGTLNDGKTLAYAWGLEIGEYRGLPFVEHGGSLGGYRAHILRFPSQHTSVALLCNASSIAPSGLARRVADTVIGDDYLQRPAATQGSVAGTRLETSPDPLSESVLRSYEGSYFSSEVDAVFRISVRGRDLFLDRETDSAAAPLLASSDGFRTRGLMIRFQTDATHKVLGLTVDAGRVRGIHFSKR